MKSAHQLDKSGGNVGMTGDFSYREHEGADQSGPART